MNKIADAVYTNVWRSEAHFMPKTLIGTLTVSIFKIYTYITSLSNVPPCIAENPMCREKNDRYFDFKYLKIYHTASLSNIPSRMIIEISVAT
jgi:hypothetical protein